MSFFNIYKTIDLTFSKEYKRAYFGSVFVAYEDIHGNIFLPIEDKEAIAVANEIYHKMLEKDTCIYTINEGEEVMLSPNSKEAQLLITGLPKEVIENQSFIKFKEGLSSLKKEAYIQAEKKIGLSQTKWFRNDFTSYCLKNGFFFPYDETQLFLSDCITGNSRIYIQENHLNKKYHKLYKEATVERFTIDFYKTKYCDDFIEFMKFFDKFSFDRRLSFFVNELRDDELKQALNEFGETHSDPYSFNAVLHFERYAYILKQYFISLINALYDDYCFEVLKQVTTKLSYLTISKIHLNRDLYSLSGYTADVFSFDGINFFFSNKDKELIESAIEKEIKENPNESILELYANLKLPYQLYSYVKDLTDISLDNIIDKFPFEDVSEEEAFISSKRYDDYYSYLTGSKEHQYAFNLRLLSKHSIKYIFHKNDYKKELTGNITLIFSNDEFSSKFKNPTPFTKDVLPSYIDTVFQPSTIIDTIKELDEKSNNTAYVYFYSAFDNKKFHDVIKDMFSFYGMDIDLDVDIMNFFHYALEYPLLLVEEEFRMAKIKNGDMTFLKIFDKTNDNEERYEPSLKFPYSTHGKLVYAFKDSVLSNHYYICKCQEHAIKSKLEYLNKIYHTDYAKRKIIDKLGLPDDVANSLNRNKDVLSQLHFRSKLCHLCNHSTPLYAEEITIDNNDTIINYYLPYIRARASEFGVYFDEPMNLNFDFSAFYLSLKNETYHGLLHFDRTKINQCLLPYVNVNKEMLASLFSSFFPNDVTYEDFYKEFNSFLSLGEMKINQLLFDCKVEDYTYIYQFENIILRLGYLYKMIELSYAIYLSRDFISSEHEFSLNIDYNHNLPHPYVFLGRDVCAYSDSPFDNNYYLSKNDKESLILFAEKYLKLYEGNHMNEEIKTPIILGLLGLPYLVTLKYSSMKMNSNNVREFFDKMNFQSGIDRRDTNITHACYIEPFRKAFPLKSNNQAEYGFARNGMLHDGFKIISDTDIDDIVYDKDHIYELDGKFDELICFYSECNNELPVSIFTFYNMDINILKNRLDDFNKLDNNDIEIKATMSGLVLDTYLENNMVFLNFINEYSNDSTLREKVMHCFPQISRVRDAIKDKVMQEILGFITYLMQLFIESYVEKERTIGR